MDEKNFFFNSSLRQYKEDALILARHHVLLNGNYGAASLDSLTFPSPFSCLTLKMYFVLKSLTESFAEKPLMQTSFTSTTQKENKLTENIFHPKF